MRSILLVVILLSWEVTSQKIINLRSEGFRIGPGERGSLDPRIDYATCSVISFGNPYRIGSTVWKSDKILGLYGGTAIDNVGSYWGGSKGIHITCHSN